MGVVEFYKECLCSIPVRDKEIPNAVDEQEQVAAAFRLAQMANLGIGQDAVRRESGNSVKKVSSFNSKK